MKNLYIGIQRFLHDEEGVTAIEYALIAALISVVAATVLTTVGTNVRTVFCGVRDAIDGTPSPCP